MVTTVHRGENQFWWQLTTSPLLADFTVTVTWFFFVALLRGQTGSCSWTCCVVWCVMCDVLNMIMFQIRHTEASPGSSSGVCVWSLSSVHAPPWHWRTLNAHLGPEFLTSWLFCGPELESVISEKLLQIYQKGPGTEIIRESRYHSCSYFQFLFNPDTVSLISQYKFKLFREASLLFPK